MPKVHFIPTAVITCDTFVHISFGAFDKKKNCTIHRDGVAVWSEFSKKALSVKGKSY